MAKRLEERDEDAMSEILRRAMQKESNTGSALRDRLLATASELGISHESVIEAEQEYMRETERRTELAAYVDAQRKNFYAHLTTYLAVNGFLLAINLLTLGNDRTLWFLYPLLGWGIGLACHVQQAFRKPGWHDDEFQTWRKHRLKEDSAEKELP